MDYLYDGSFDGLLTCIYYNYYQETASGIYPQEFYQPTIISNCTTILTNPDHAAIVYKAIEEKMSSTSLRQVYFAFLSSCPGKENIILDYLRLGFRKGAKINYYHSHPHVHPLHKIARQVSREVHRFLGLLRFADHDRFLYAILSPDHDILALIADHFTERLPNERWIIHDQKRNTAVIYDGKSPHETKRLSPRHWYLIDLDHNLEPPIPDKADQFQELWKLYFNKISIESRCNPRLQSQFIPQRYRQHVVEFKP